MVTIKKFLLILLIIVCIIVSIVSSIFIINKFVLSEKNGIKRINLADLSKDDSKIHGKGNFIALNNNIYFINPIDQGRIYRVCSDGSNLKMICNENHIYNFYMDSKWIYFTKSNGLFRINLNGKSKMKLSEDIPIKLTILKDWIYYSCTNNKNDKEFLSLIKIKKDGTEKTKVLDNVIFDYTICNGFIYTTMDTGSNAVALYNFKLDGSFKKYICEAYKIYIDTYNSEIIFSKKDGLYIYFATNNSIRKISQDLPNYFVISDDNIYYVKQKHNIIRVNLKTKEVKKVFADKSPVIDLHTIGNWIFYNTFSINNNVLKVKVIKSDGTKKQLFLS